MTKAEIRQVARGLAIFLRERKQTTRFDAALASFVWPPYSASIWEQTAFLNILRSNARAIVGGKSSCLTPRRQS